MRRGYIELADKPLPPAQINRHHELKGKGKLKGFWEYEVDGGAPDRGKWVASFVCAVHSSH